MCFRFINSPGIKHELCKWENWVLGSLLVTPRSSEPKTISEILLLMPDCGLCLWFHITQCRWEKKILFAFLSEGGSCKSLSQSLVWLRLNRAVSSSSQWHWSLIRANSLHADGGTKPLVSVKEMFGWPPLWYCNRRLAFYFVFVCVCGIVIYVAWFCPPAPHTHTLFLFWCFWGYILEYIVLLVSSAFLALFNADVLEVCCWKWLCEREDYSLPRFVAKHFSFLIFGKHRHKSLNKEKQHNVSNSRNLFCFTVKIQERWNHNCLLL